MRSAGQLGCVREAEERGVHRRHALEDRRGVLRQQPGRLGCVEPRQQQHARAGSHRGVERARLAERVEQRQAAEHHVVAGQGQQVGLRDADVADQVGVRELGAFGLAGGARGVEDDRGVVLGPVDDTVGGLVLGEDVGERRRIDLDDLRAGDPGRTLPGIGGRAAPGEDQPGTRVGQVVGDLSGLEQRVHRYDDTAGPEHAVVERGELRNVGEHDRDPVARLDTALGEEAGDPGAGRGQFAVADREVVEAERDLLGLRGRRCR